MRHPWMTRAGALCALTAVLVVAATPAAAQGQKQPPAERADDKADKADKPDKPDTTLKGRVQSVHEDRIVVRTDQGQAVSVKTKDISAETRNLIQTGEPIVVTGPLTGDQMTARSLTVAATTAGARALAGQPPLTPADAGAASPETEGKKRR